MESFENLYKRYYRSVVTFLVRFGIARHEAHDLAQDVFVRVYEHRNEYRGDAEWKFLEVIARRVALNHVRDRGAKKRKGAGATVALEELKEPPASGAPTQETLLSHREQKAIHLQNLRVAVDGLPRSLRVCVLLQLEGRTYLEIADALRISVDAVKARLHQAKIHLKEKLPKERGDLRWLDDLALEDDHDE